MRPILEELILSIRDFIGKRNNAINSLVAVLGMAMLVVMLFSAVFVASETMHDCQGDECPVCAMIHQCENNLNQLGGMAVPFAALITVVFILFVGMLNFDIFHIYSTLVSNMVRMND